MEHVNSVVWRIPGNNFHTLIFTQNSNILHGSGFVRLNIHASRSLVGVGTDAAGDNLKVDQMDMDRVGPSTIGAQQPLLGGSAGHIAQDTALGRTENLVIDGPGPTNTSGEAEGLGNWHADICRTVKKTTHKNITILEISVAGGIGDRALANDKPHDS